MKKEMPSIFTEPPTRAGIKDAAHVAVVSCYLPYDAKDIKLKPGQYVKFKLDYSTDGKYKNPYYDEGDYCSSYSYLDTGEGYPPAPEYAVVPCGREEALGIVDPFLNKEIKTTDYFWVLLLPNTVTGLRHEYSHPILDNMAYVESKIKASDGCYGC